MSITSNLEALRSRIEGACERAGRDPASVTLVAVSKTVPVERIREAVEAGVTDLGENYIQEAQAKISAISGPGDAGDDRRAALPRWHFIGHLQRNKAKVAARLFDSVQSVDSYPLARELDRRAGALERRLPVLVEVNLGEEESKFGVEEAAAVDLVRQVAALEHLRVNGLMTMPPFFDDPEDSRPYFSRLRALRDRIRGEGIERVSMDALSMGLSADFEVAIEEGATLVRVGTAIFGHRRT